MNIQSHTSILLTLATATLHGQSVEPPSTSKATDSDVYEMETFTVYAGSRANAIDLQKESDIVGSFLSPDAFGNLPDDTIGDALNRLPGINVVAENQISIRGVEGKYNSVQLDGNGLAQASNSTGAGRGSDTRNFDVSSVPVEAIDRIEVIKSLTPDRDADSIGGMINMITNDAFNLSRSVTKMSGEYRYDSFSEEPGWGGSLTYGRVLNNDRTIGLMLNLSFREESRLFDRVEIRQSNQPPIDDNGNPKTPQLSEIDPRDFPSKSFRATLSGSLDWKMSDATKLYFKPFINFKENDDEELRTRIRQLNSNRNRVEIDEDHVQTDELRLERRNRWRPDQEYTTSRFTFGGETEMGDALLTYSISQTDSSNDVLEYRTDFTNPTAERRKWRVISDNTNRLMPSVEAFLIDDPSVSFGDSDIARQGLQLSRFRFTNFTSDEDGLVARVDYETRLQSNNPVTLKFGAKHRAKSRQNRLDIDDFRPDASDFGRVLSEIDFPTYRSMETLGGIYSNLGSFVAIDPVLDLYNADPSKFNSTYGGEFNNQLAKLYDAEEDVTSLYGMAKTQVENLTLVGGLRYENTDIQYNWRGSLITPPHEDLPHLQDKRGSNSYGDLFPSMVATWRLQNNHIIRAAYSATISRPDYEDLVPFDLADVQSVWGSYVRDSDIDIGNPDLRPQTADNFDLAYEFYYGESNNLSIGVFRKELDDFLVRRTSQIEITHPEDPLDPNSPLETETLRSRQEINGSQQTVSGLELSWTQSFENVLPAPFAGTGFVANYTYITGEETIPTFDSSTGEITGESVSDALTNQPEAIYNFQLYWDVGDLSARVAYNYVDRVKRNVFDVDFPVFQAERETIDASVQYRLNDTYRIVLDVKNLNKEPRRFIYNTLESFPESYGLSDRQYVLGVRAQF